MLSQTARHAVERTHAVKIGVCVCVCVYVCACACVCVSRRGSSSGAAQTSCVLHTCLRATSHHCTRKSQVQTPATTHISPCTHSVHVLLARTAAQGVVNSAFYEHLFIASLTTDLASLLSYLPGTREGHLTRLSRGCYFVSGLSEPCRPVGMRLLQTAIRDCMRCCLYTCLRGVVPTMLRVTAFGFALCHPS